MHMVHKKRPARQKHVPQRTCIACREVEGKRGLIRLVRTDGGVVVDSTGKMAGRGAYLHPTQQCWQIAMAGNHLGSALRTQISAESRATLAEFMTTLPVDDTIDDDSIESVA